MGGPEAVLSIPVEFIPHPLPQEQQPSLQQLATQCRAWQAPTDSIKGDLVSAFGEAAAAYGALGRFPGSSVMGIVKQFTGVPAKAC
jgi:hypothetical protein